MTRGKLSIHSENILPIIKKWLYSEKEIFLRELISNACDAISKVKILKQEKILQDDEAYRIDVIIDKGAKTLKVADNGIGMTSEEVEKYIAQIAFSGAEEFLKKYEGQKERFIGHFGLGFFSSYMVAKNVAIDTLSYQGGRPVFWSCDGSSDYLLEEGRRKARGTTVTLHLEDEEYLNEDTIEKLLLRFCPYLPYPIYLNDRHINNKEPLWLKSPSDCSEEEYLSFFHELYPLEPDPVLWIHLNVDYPFKLNGILYFPKLNKEMDLNKSAIKLFCNRVFVSDDCKDLLLDYLMVLKGAIDSPDIPLNVSRSYLQSDKTVKQVGGHIAKKLADRLTSLYESEFTKFTSYWNDIEPVIKLGILQDEKFFERAKNFLIFETTSSKWLSLSKLEKTVFYTNDKKSSLLSMYKEDVIIARNLDYALFSYLERKSIATFKRIDGEIDEKLLDSSREKNLLDTEGISESVKIANFTKSVLDISEVEVEAKSLVNDDMAMFITLKEEERRFRDYMQLFHGQGSLIPKKTVIINTNNRIINKVYKLGDIVLAKLVIRHLYYLALIEQKEMKEEEFSSFLKGTEVLLERLLL